MDLTAKAKLLESCLSKAELDVDYSISVAWGDTTPREMRVLIDNTRLYVKRMGTLDYDVRMRGIANYQRQLDEMLSKFPEYANNLEKEGTMRL